MSDDGHSVALPPNKEQAMAYLQALADDCSDGDQAYVVLEAPLEVLAAALGDDKIADLARAAGFETQGM